MPLVMLNFMEELQSYIADNSGTGLVVAGAGVSGGNFTISNILDIDNLDRAFGQGIDCTMFEESGTLTRTGRRHFQDRTVRFVYKGYHGQEAVNLCYALLQYLENKRKIVTDTFSAWVARTDKTPTVITADQGGTHLADFVMTFLVQNRTG